MTISTLEDVAVLHEAYVKNEAVVVGDSSDVDMTKAQFLIALPASELQVRDSQLINNGKDALIWLSR